MFEDVAQMEKEIETFRKNIVASSELIEKISRLTDAVEHQKEAFSTSSEELVKKIDSCIKHIQTNNEATINTLSENNNIAITNLQTNMSTEQALRMGELQQIKTALENLQATYAERLQKTEITIGTYHTKLDDSVRQIKANHKETLKDLSERVDSAIADLQKSASADLMARVGEIEKIKVTIEEYQVQSAKRTDEQIQQLVKECTCLIAEMKTTLASQQSVYIEKLQQTEQVIREYHTDVEQKYNTFIKKLEAINVNQIFDEVQDLKQSIQTKFMILMSGIGVAIVVSAVGLILK